MFLLIVLGGVALIGVAAMIYVVSSAISIKCAIAKVAREGANPWLLTAVDAFSTLAMGTGILVVASPAALYWFIHGDDERYLWIIRGPYPFSHFGGGPSMLWVGVGLLLSGVAITNAGMGLRRWFWKHIDTS